MENKYVRGTNAQSNGNEVIREQRIPVLICVDRSGSMRVKVDDYGENKLDLAYNCIVNDFIKDIMATPTLKYSVRLAVITFGDDAKVIKPFDEIRNEQSNKKIAHIKDKVEINNKALESGDLYKGIEESLNLIQSEKEYIQNVLKTGRKAPWLIIMSDGRPSREGYGVSVIKTDEYKDMAHTLLDLDSNSKMNIIPVCFYEGDISTVSQTKGYRYLNSLTNTYKDIIPVVNPSNRADFTKFFRILSSSLKAGKQASQTFKTEITKRYSNENVDASKTIDVETLAPIKMSEPEAEKKEPETNIEPYENKEIVEEKPLEPVFHIYLNDEEIKMQPISKDGNLAAYTFTNNKDGDLLSIEREGLGPLKFNDTGEKTYKLANAPCRYKIYINSSNTIYIVADPFPFTKKPTSEEAVEKKKENNGISIVDEYFDLNDIINDPFKKE